MNHVTPLHRLLKQEVNRREFLVSLGLGLLSLLGLSSILHFLTGKSTSHHATSNNSLGYTQRDYGN